MNTYDRILFIGLGLSTAVTIRRLLDKKFTGEIVVVEKGDAPERCKRWCAWEPLPQGLSHLTSARWEHWSATNAGQSSTNTSREHAYTQIHASDFWDDFISHSENAPNLRILYKTPFTHSADAASFQAAAHEICGWKPNLTLDSRPPLLPKGSLQQQFVGYTVEACRPTFSPDCAQLMHFDDSQASTIAFTYCLPYSTNRALVEYTLFDSHDFNPDTIKGHLTRSLKQNFGLSEPDFSIIESEQGCLPMEPIAVQTAHSGYWPIGIASGLLRASSGYGLIPIHHHAVACADSILAGATLPQSAKRNGLTDFLDFQFCKILKVSPTVGRRALFCAFDNMKTPSFIKLMRGEITFGVALETIWAMPKWAFLKILLSQKR